MTATERMTAITEREQRTTQGFPKLDRLGLDIRWLLDYCEKLKAVVDTVKEARKCEPPHCTRCRTCKALDALTKWEQDE